MYSYDFKDTLRKLLVIFILIFIFANFESPHSGFWDSFTFSTSGGGGGRGADGVGGLDHDCLLSNITQMLLHNGGFCNGCIVKGFIYRLPECLSNYMNWVPPPHPPSVAPLIGPKWGETPSLAGDGVGGPNSDDWTGTLVLYCIY
jgi:hypothetical protein